ncbi:MAG: hypothetical protein HYV26_13565 [Candidatus Hydrogenedentes bacterium]|nr:hypothetical protein [Candidatus Hydrogenedentota bacterium]
MKQVLVAWVVAGATVMGGWAAAQDEDKAAIDAETPAVTETDQPEAEPATTENAEQKGATPEASTPESAETSEAESQEETPAEEPMRLAMALDKTWDSYAWKDVEPATYYGHFVDLLGFVSGEINPEPKAPASAESTTERDKPAATAEQAPKLLAFVQDRSPVTELLVATGYIALFGEQSDLRLRAGDFGEQRVKVTARKYERNGLNIMLVTAVDAAPKPMPATVTDTSPFIPVAP